MPKTKTPTRSSSPADRTDADRSRCTAYARAVVAGEIVAGPHVRNACRRHLDDKIAGPDRGLEFRPEAAEEAVNWFEGVLRLDDKRCEKVPRGKPGDGGAAGGVTMPAAGPAAGGGGTPAAARQPAQQTFDDI